MSKEVTCITKQNLDVLSESDKGYTKEINLVSWNGADAKLDIRSWYPEHEKCGKGITLSDSEGRKLMETLVKFYAEIDNE